MNIRTKTTTDILDDTAWEIPTFLLYELQPKRTDYCVCIPIINEGDRISTQLVEMRACGIDRQADILICDGGSTDGSTDLSLLRASGVRALLVKTGPGKLSAQLRMGYAYALRQGYLGIVTIDGNGKDGVDAIPRFLHELDAGFDLIQGSRFIMGGEAVRTPWLRWCAIRLLHAPLLSLAARFWYTDTTNGFRGYSRRYLLDPRVQPFRNLFNTYELLAYLSVRAPQLGMATKEIPARRAYPAGGELPTKITRGSYAALLRIVWKTITGSYEP